MAGILDSPLLQGLRHIAEAQDAAIVQRRAQTAPVTTGRALREQLREELRVRGREVRPQWGVPRLRRELGL